MASFWFETCGSISRSHVQSVYVCWLAAPMRYTHVDAAGLTGALREAQGDPV